MLIIRHRTGPLAGKDQRVDGREPDRIVFGRDPAACDVVYPPDTAIVSRRHFALVKKPSGDWTIDLFGDPYVAMNGEAADLGAPVRSGAVFELGTDGGPSFEVVIPEEEAADQFPRTLAQKAVKGSHAAARHAEKAAARARRLAVAGVVFALLVAAGVGAVLYMRDAADRQFAEELQALRQRQDRLAADSIPRE